MCVKVKYEEKKKRRIGVETVYSSLAPTQASRAISRDCVTWIVVVLYRRVLPPAPPPPPFPAFVPSRPSTTSHNFRTTCKHDVSPLPARRVTAIPPPSHPPCLRSFASSHNVAQLPHNLQAQHVVSTPRSSRHGRPSLLVPPSCRLSSPAFILKCPTPPRPPTSSRLTHFRPQASCLHQACNPSPPHQTLSPTPPLEIDESRRRLGG